ncbi:hypothetical protein ACFYU9_25130 [Streptomyces sp. NPDC004327]|uniref:hypothetical protein n=1 Tax=Streptomyces sp. NPDC004327 TaxID=3364699 RepID=UPI0036B2DCBA
MGIPDWLVWITFGLAALQALGLVPAIRRLREPDLAVRSKARLDLLETVSTLLLVGGLLLSFTLADSWFWLTAVGFALMTAVYVAKGVRLLRARRHPAA